MFVGIGFYLRITIHQSRKGGGKEMKKLTVLCLAGLLVLAFGAIGYAQAPKLDFRASGAFWFDTYYMRNVSPYAATAGIYKVASREVLLALIHDT